MFNKWFIKLTLFFIFALVGHPTNARRAIKTTHSSLPKIIYTSEVAKRSHVADSNVNDYIAVKINNKTIQTGFPQNLDFQHKNIQFQITPVSKNVVIKYRLITLTDSSWQTCESGKCVVYLPGLAPGNYRFEAMGLSGDTIQKLADYSFTIHPFWWQQWWLKLLLAIVLVLLAVRLHHIYDAKQQKLKDLLKAKDELLRAERQRISSEIHDDISSGLFAIKLYADMVKSQREDVSEIHEISNMVNSVSDKIKEIIWSTNMENDILENLIYYIQYQITSLFKFSDISFEAYITDDIPHVNIDSLSRRNIYLITKELTHNAIKHAKCNKVILHINLIGNSLIISVEDDGIGFDPQVVKANSMGLHNVKSRIEKLQGELSIDSRQGTVVKVTIPLLNNKNIA